MSLRLRLFLAFASLLAIFAAILLVGLLRLNRDLNAAFGESAVEIGHTIITVLTEQSDGSDGPVRQIRRRIERTSDSQGATKESDSQDVIFLGADGHAESASARVDVTPDAAGDARVVMEFKGDGDGVGAAMTSDLGKLSIKRLHVDDGSQALWVSGEGVDEAIPLPQTGLNRALLGYSENLLWGVIVLLLIGLLVAFWLAHRITAPLRGLSLAADALASGQLGVKAETAGSPEIRQTIATFNHMSTELADMQRQAEQLRQRQALTELGEIGRGLAHALRNPLHAVGLAVEELADRSPDSADARHLHDTARSQLSRIDQALRGFLALAAGEGAMETDVDLRELAEDVLLEASQTGTGRVLMTLVDGEPEIVRGVPAELRILLHSLIINAVEASPEGGRVSVAVGSQPDVAQPFLIEVTDQGTGIADTIRERLFQPHVSSKPDGAGMGLYLAQRLAALRYGGRIELANREEGGCSATLTLNPRSST